METVWMGRGAWWWRKSKPLEICDICQEPIDWLEYARCDCGKRVHARCMRTCEVCHYYACMDCIKMMPDGQVLCDECRTTSEVTDGELQQRGCRST